MGQNQDNAQENQDERNDGQEQNQSPKGDGGKKGSLLLDYSLTPMKNAAVFTIHRQHPNVDDFLKKVGMFRASNGLTIELGQLYPEWKESMDLLFLDGTKGKAIDRPDIVRFAPVLHYQRNGSHEAVVKGRQVRNNKIQRVHDAIAELCQAVSDTYRFTTLESASKPDLGRMKIVG